MRATAGWSGHWNRLVPCSWYLACAPQPSQMVPVLSITSSLELFTCSPFICLRLAPLPTLTIANWWQPGESAYTSLRLSLSLSEGWRSKHLFPRALGSPLLFFLPGDTIQIFCPLTSRMGSAGSWWELSSMQPHPPHSNVHAFIAVTRTHWGSTLAHSHAGHLVGMRVPPVAFFCIFLMTRRKEPFVILLLTGICSSAPSLFKDFALFSVASSVIFEDIFIYLNARHWQVYMF